MIFKGKILLFLTFARELLRGIVPCVASKTNRIVNDPLFECPRGTKARLLAKYKVAYSLTYGSPLDPHYIPNFDSRWYVKQYKDVAGNQLLPFFHFVFFGRSEGRLANDSRLDKYDALLWLGRPELMQTKLKRLLVSSDNEEDKARALWYLSRWYAYNGYVEEALHYVEELFFVISTFKVKPNKSYITLVIDVATKAKQFSFTEKSLKLLEESYPNCNEYHLLKSNLLQKICSPNAQWVNHLNKILLANNCFPIVLGEKNRLEACKKSFSLLVEDTKKPLSPLISVIVPAYNAAKHLASTLDALRHQTYRNIEVIVVNDASTDDTYSVYKKWLVTNPDNETFKLKYVENKQNKGAYHSRNVGMQLAKGDFLTVNDADDWAHCQKLEFQCSAFIDDSIQATVSSCVRVTSEFHFKCVNIEQVWIQRNVSSLMIRKRVLSSLGYWDEVKANADTEYYYRLETAFGLHSIKHVLPGAPLSMQLVRDESLTNSKTIGLNTQFEGPRKWYMDAAIKWHNQSKDSLYLGTNLAIRPFRAPNALLKEGQINPEDWAEQIKQSGLWDAAWYVQRYQDVQEGGMHPFDHFQSRGLLELRDPGPRFSLSSYVQKEQCEAQQAVIRYSRTVDANSYYLGKFESKRAQSENLNVLLVGHQAKQVLFGAERSLLDLAKLLCNLKFNVFVLLPEALNFDYIEQLLQHSSKVIVAPYTWWFNGKQPNLETVDIIKDVLTENNIDILHTNTLVLDEPLVAAKELNIEAAVHIREDLPTDRALCETLLCSPEQAISRLVEYGCNILCNSNYCLQQTKNLLPESFNKHISSIYNLIECENTDIITSPKAESVSVGLISSNIEKKGVGDFIKVANICAGVPGLSFKIYGPKTAYLENAMAQATDNVEFCGYVDTPSDAISTLNVVLSLSSFSETFGRSVAEAQLLGKVAIAYDKGAVSELIQNGDTGFLVPCGNVQGVVDVLMALKDDSSLRNSIGYKAKRFATDSFSEQALLTKFSSFFKKLK